MMGITDSASRQRKHAFMAAVYACFSRLFWAKCRNQALAQVCAVCSPWLGVLSVIAIFHQPSNQITIRRPRQPLSTTDYVRYLYLLECRHTITPKLVWGCSEQPHSRFRWDCC